MKKLSLVLVLVMLFSMFSFAAAEEPTELVITVYDDNTAQYDENSVVIKALEEKLNVKLTFNRIINDDYSSKQTLALTSMEMGDLWMWKAGSTDEMNEYGDLGAFVNLKDYEDKMPNMFAMYEKYAKETEPLYSKDTGAMYGAFRIYDFPYANETIMIRKDIVEKVGYTLDDIKTIDDLTEVLYAMKAAYPNSTPLQGKWGISYALNIGKRAANTGLGIFYDLTVGEYSYAGISDAMREVTEWYAQLTKDGIFNPNVDQSGEDYLSAVINGECFVTYYYANEGKNFNMKGKAVDPDFEFTAIRMPSWTEGSFITPLDSQSVFEQTQFVIPTNSKNIDKAIEYLDYLYSEEAAILTCWGVEGETYYVGEDGQKYYMEPIAAAYNEGTETTTSFGLGWSTEIVRVFLDDAYAGGLDQASKDGLKCAHEDSLPKYNWPSLTWTDEQKEAAVNLKTPLDTLATENIAKFIIGERDLSEWDAYVEEAKAMGVDELVEMYNARLAEANAAE